MIVTVSNQSGTPVRDVRVHATPSQMEFGAIEHGDRKRAWFVPSQDSNLSIEFLDPSGQRVSSRIDNYYTPGYCGNTDIVIHRGFELSHVENIDIYPCWHSPATLLGLD